tara:strand:- start:3507 stop:3767 length:261 start_codon:yes stop_codon:yes gene_type:complete
MAAQTEKQFKLLHGDEQKWSKTTRAVYEHLFAGKRRIVAANDNNVSEQSMYSFIKNNEHKHLKQAQVLEDAIAYQESALEARNETI